MKASDLFVRCAPLQNDGLRCRMLVTLLNFRVHLPCIVLVARTAQCSLKSTTSMRAGPWRTRAWTTYLVCQVVPLKTAARARSSLVTKNSEIPSSLI